MREKKEANEKFVAMHTVQRKMHRDAMLEIAIVWIRRKRRELENNSWLRIRAVE